MEQDFIELSIGRILLLRNNKEVQYKKEVNGKIQELTIEEINYLKRLFNKERSYIYESAYLDYLIESNDNIENKPYIKNFLEIIENSIPIGWEYQLAI